MFETDSIPQDWVGRLNQMDEVWVPTAFNVETFAKAGVTVPIQVVPGGVDATLFRPALRPLRVPGARGTVFLSIFEWAFRKGWDVFSRPGQRPSAPRTTSRWSCAPRPSTGAIVRLDTD